MCFTIFNQMISNLFYNKMSHIEYVPEINDTFAENSQRQPFGKLKVLLKNKLCLITIGPNYCLFISAFSFFLIVAIGMINIVFNNSQNVYFRVATILICFGQPLSYLNVALSNPGIVSKSIIEVPPQEVSTTETLEITASQVKIRKNKQKYCKKCKIYVKPTTFHCGDCQLCIDEYDHHCPWVSKCIGGQNLGKFYLFLGMTPAFLIYCFISFLVCTTLGIVERASIVQS